MPEQQTAILDFCAKTDPKISQRLYCTDCIKCSRTTSKSVPEIKAAALGNVLYLSLKLVLEIYLENSAKSVLYDLQ